MAGSRHAHELAKLAQIDDTALVKGRALKALANIVRRIVPIPGKNITGVEKPDGIVLSAENGGRSSCVFAGSLHGETFHLASGGTLNLAVPSNLVVSGALWTGTVAAGTTRWIVLEAEFTDARLSSLALAVHSSTPPPSPVSEGTPPSELIVPLYLCTGGEAYRLVGCGALTATAEITLTTDQPSPVCGQDPTIRHWKWRVSQ